MINLPLCDRKSPGARVVDSKLILSYPNAIKPVLWQMDLAQTSSSSFEIDTDLKEGHYALVMKTSGKAEEIASFEAKDDAASALFSIGEALGKSGKSACRVMMAGDAAQASGNGGRALAALAGIILIAVLVAAIMNMSPRPPASIVAAMEAQQATGGGSGVGEPVSADAFLRGM